MKTKTLAITTAATVVPLLMLLSVATMLPSASAQTEKNKDWGRPELNDEQKQALEQIHQLKREGKYDEAQALADESGLTKFHHRMGKFKKRHGKFLEIRQTIIDGDYEAFVELTKDAPFADQINEEVFAKLGEAHNLHEAGDHEGARAIMEGLGISFPPEPEFHHKFEMNITDEQRQQVKELMLQGDHEAARELMRSFHEEG